MELMALLGILVMLGLLAGAPMGWIALFRTRKLRDRIETLEREVARLAAALASLPTRPTVAAPMPSPQVQPKVQLGARPTYAAPAGAPAAPAAIAPTPLQPPASPAPAGPRGFFRAIEASLAGNWLVYVAGGALALGGVLLVAYAIERGLLGPWPRVILGGVAGLGMLGASEWLRRKGFSAQSALPGAFPGALRRPRAHSAAPAMTAGAGLVTLYGAVYAAQLYQLIPAWLAFTLLAATAAGGTALALVHGPILVALGLVGAVAAPLLIGSDDPSAAALFAYVFAVTAVGLAVTRLVSRRWPALVALAGGTLWPLLWLVAAFDGDQVWALAVYLPALLAAAIAFTWDIARDPPELVTALSFRRLASSAPRSIATAYLAALAVFALLWLLSAHHNWSNSIPVALAPAAAGSLLALFAAWRREALFALPLIALAGAGLVLYEWPPIEYTLTHGITGLEAPNRAHFFPACAAFAALFGLGGLLAQDRLRLKGAMAAVTAGGPPLILAVAFWRMHHVDPGVSWGFTAIALGLAYLYLLERQANTRTSDGSGGVDAAPGPAAAYALGASASAGMAVGMALEQLWMSVGFGLLAPIAALLHRRFRVPVLRWAAAAFAVIAAARLAFFPEVSRFEVGGLPILNMLLWGYGLPIVAIWAASRILMQDGAPNTSRTVQTVKAAALSIAVAFVSVEIRHLINGGDLDAPYFSGLAEIGLQTSAWLALALLLRWRLGPDLYFVARWGERLLIAAALTQTVFVLLFWSNPWWGPWASRVDGPPILNPLLLAYALPAALAAAWAVVARRQGLARAAGAAGLVGSALAFAWITLETRHLFHPGWLTSAGPDGGAQPVLGVERYAYSTAWLVYAGALLALGAVRRRPSLRYAAFGLLVVVVIKVFLDIWSGLDGALRGLSVVGLGAALMAIAVLYQRLGPRFARSDQREASA